MTKNSKRKIEGRWKRVSVLLRGWNYWPLILLLLVGFIFILSYGVRKTLYYKGPEISTKEEVSRFPSKIAPKYRIAIVIDDMGYNIDRARELLSLKVPISLAVLPYLLYSTQIAKEAKVRGRDVLLHLPMEPKDYPDEDPGEGSIFLSMSDEKILDQVQKDLEAIPHIIGVNNHMGSKFSEDSSKMTVVLKAVREKNLFFLDSKTTARSTGYSLAKEMGLKTIDRQIFLDNDKDIEYTLAQFKELIRIAKERGSAVAIGHPHPTTIAALKEMIDKFEEEGVEVVPVSSLLD